MFDSTKNLAQAKPTCIFNPIPEIELMFTMVKINNQGHRRVIQRAFHRWYQTREYRRLVCNRQFASWCWTDTKWWSSARQGWQRSEILPEWYWIRRKWWASWTGRSACPIPSNGNRDDSPSSSSFGLQSRFGFPLLLFSSINFACQFPSADGRHQNPDLHIPILFLRTKCRVLYAKGIEPLLSQ